ncbi:ATP-binding protein [Deinococcus sp. D7000]|nr:ATP-binding protein [Deinococcus sp. D7000]
MLIQFSIKNYRSIREPVTLDFIASKIKSRDPRIDESNVIDFGKRKVLKSVGIYGANASGKSNVLKALKFVQYMITSSATKLQIGDPINVEPFMLDDDSRHLPSLFELIFVIDDTRYRYGFEANEKEILEEWLYWTPKSHERRLFHRIAGDVSLGDDFGEAKALKRFVRSNALFISSSAQFNTEISTRVIEYFRRMYFLHGTENVTRGLSVVFIERGIMYEEIKRFLNSFDVGIEDIELGEKPELSGIQKMALRDKGAEEFWSDNQRKVITFHNRRNSLGDVVGIEKFDLEKNESHGTQKIFALAGLVTATLFTGGVLVIDEVDAQLHPLITRSLIRMFNSSKANQNGAQIIFATHDTNLLDSKILRRDQIWFAEKNRVDSTELYSLADYDDKGKKIRSDASFERNYISGRYGGIPYLESFEFSDYDETLSDA